MVHPPGPIQNHGSKLPTHRSLTSSSRPLSTHLSPRAHLASARARSAVVRSRESLSARLPARCWCCGCGVCSSFPEPGAAVVNRMSGIDLLSLDRAVGAREETVVGRMSTMLRNRQVPPGDTGTKGDTGMMCDGLLRFI